MTLLREETEWFDVDLQAIAPPFKILRVENAYVGGRILVIV